MIRFEDVSKKFADGTEALKKVSFTIPKEKLTVIIGPSGCGKTTLMKMINRLEIPTSGEIYIDNEAISSMDSVELRKTIGYVIQRIGLFPHMTIEKNASLVPNLKGWSKEKTKEAIERLMQLVELDPEQYLTKYPLELSGGQQQRVGVVRALAGNPNIVLMDEPFSALDPISREQLQIETKNLQEKIKKTIVFVTHDMDEALKIADNIIVMRNGEIEQIGTPQDLLERPLNDFIKNFIGLDRINRQRPVGSRELQDFIPYFEENVQGAYEEVDAKMVLEEAIFLLEQNNSRCLRVTNKGTHLGYITRASLLRALLGKEGAM